MILVDTNLLLRAIISGDPQHEVAVRAIKAVRQLGYITCVVPQVIYEFWVVVTRPVSDNGIGWSCDRARSEVDEVVANFPLLAGNQTLYDEWLALVTSHQVHGKTAHDARLVAAMMQHGIDYLLSFNAKHFQQFPAVTVIAPGDVEDYLPSLEAHD